MVSGTVEPDIYVVTKAGPAIKSVCVGHQKMEIIAGPDGRDTKPNYPRSEKRVLRDSEVIDLATLGLAVESHYGARQGTERAMTGGHTPS